ncbi:S26 family signal peptidase [Pigmentiphaga sp.]|uniref:S26 family signal peptidase n=1 Tax=Pigmentiphaga sp. TaxID=1977564 RepID=UPI0025D331B2|nr:S26 family signal peptidase [Pigmentiphaga sp.]
MRRRSILACMSAGLVALTVPAAVRFPVQVVYNPSDSVPRGWYRVEHEIDADSLHVGSIVLARLPADAAALAAQRRYLPGSVPLLKRIGAVAPQSVCIRGRIVRIDGAAVATVLAQDGARRPLSAWTHCRPLADGEVFLLSSTNPASFDSRYFGPIAASAVLGIARPMWTWNTP